LLFIVAYYILKHIPYGEWWSTTHESYVSVHFLEYLLMLFWLQKLEYIVMVLDLSTCVGPSSCNVYLYRVELSIHYNPVFFIHFTSNYLYWTCPFIWCLLMSRVLVNMLQYVLLYQYLCITEHRKLQKTWINTMYSCWWLICTRASLTTVLDPSSTCPFPKKTKLAEII
jgi:hypothetical protein